MTRNLLIPIFSTSQRVSVSALIGVTVGWMVLLVAISSWQQPWNPGPTTRVGPTVGTLIGHMALFAVLGFLLFYDVCYFAKRHRVLLGVGTACLVGLVWGSITEWYQMYVPNRVASMEDVVANTAGAILGSLVLAGVSRVIRIPGLPRGQKVTPKAARSSHNSS